MNRRRVAWLGRLGKVVVALALIAAFYGYDVSLKVETKEVKVDFSFQKSQD